MDIEYPINGLPLLSSQHKVVEQTLSNIIIKTGQNTFKTTIVDTETQKPTGNIGDVTMMNED